MMRLTTIGLLIGLLAATTVTSAQEASVTVSQQDVTSLGGMVVPDVQAVVALPQERPLAKFTFTARGAALLHAEMLDEQYRRDTALRTVPGPPQGRLAEGQLDLVTTWDWPFLPYRLTFSELSASSRDTSLVRRVAQRGTSGEYSDGKLTLGDPSTRSVNRPVMAGDMVDISGPGALKGTYRVDFVESSGVLSISPKPTTQAASSIVFEVYRTGKLKTLFEADPTYTLVTGAETASTLPLTWVWPDPITDKSPVYVEKRYEQGEHPYELKLTVIVHNVGATEVKLQSGLRVSAWQHEDETLGSMFSFPTFLQASSCYSEGAGLNRWEYSELIDETNYQWPSADEGGGDLEAQQARWVGVDTRYFILAALSDSTKATGQCYLTASPQPPAGNGTISAVLYQGSNQTLKSGQEGCVPTWLTAASGRPSCDAAFDALGYPPGTARGKLLKNYQLKREQLSGAELEQLEVAWASLKKRERSIQRYRLFAGPKDSAFLGQTGYSLDASLDFGILDFISSPLLALMAWFHEVFGHWAIAIVMLTLVLKLALLPLTHKSFVSMQKMQVLRPQLTELKEEYGDRKEEFARAQMALFKREGVSPLGGCLPMLVQMPIWFALYQTIYSSVELFNAPLGAWITDLSGPDPYYILPVILGILMLVQQMFTPTAAGMDETQAKMMKYGMPVMFSFFMVALPSGLVLYIMVNTILTVFQNLYIRRQMA